MIETNGIIKVWLVTMIGYYDWLVTMIGYYHLKSGYMMVG